MGRRLTSRPIKSEAIKIIARERPDILFIMLKENFLPPPQMVYVIQSLEGYSDRQILYKETRHLLRHYSSAVVEATARILGIGNFGGDNDAA